MTKFTKVKTGDLIKVPLRQDAWTYARILIEGSYAFYDCLSTTDRADFEQIIKSDILFIAHVDIFAIKDGHWTIVTNIPLEERLAKLHPRYFNPAPMNQENVNFYEVYKTKQRTQSEKIGLKLEECNWTVFMDSCTFKQELMIIIAEKEMKKIKQTFGSLKSILDLLLTN